MDALVVRAQVLAETRLAELGRRLDHVRGVARAASAVADRLELRDAGTLVCAAWLHDIGYAPSVRRTAFHPVDGAEFLAAEGFGSVVVSLVAYHTGAEVEAEERGLVAELERFARPDQEVLDLLTYADLTTGPDGVPLSVDERIAEILRRYGPDEVVHRAVSRSAPDLLASAARVEERLARAARAGQPR